MKTHIMNRNCFMFILVALLLGFGVQGSYAQTITASTPQPLTEANLHGSPVTLTLNGGTYERSEWDIERALTISGIAGVTVDRFGVDRVSDTEVTIELEFADNIDANGTLTFTVGAGAISGYNGNALTATIPVTAMQESLAASTELPLTEETLHGSVVTLTLSGRRFNDEWDIARALAVSGIDGVTVETFGVDRVSDTDVTIELEFAGNIDANGTLTFTVGAGAIAGYNQGFTTQLLVTAVSESLVVSTELPLTEETLHGSVVTLTLSGRRFNDEWDIARALAVSGIDGVTVETFGVDRVSDTDVTIELEFAGNIDANGTLTFTVGAGAIAGYNQGFTTQLLVTAVSESLVVSTEFPLSEATLYGSVVTLTLSGRRFNDEWGIARALTVSGIDSVTVDRFLGVDRVSNTEVTIELAFDGDFDTDATLTFTVGADAIAGYDEDFIAQVPVTAAEQSNATVSVSPSPVVSPAIGELLTLSLKITNGANVAGYQAIVLFDPTALRYVESTNGDYLPADAFFLDLSDNHNLGEWRFGRVILAASTLADARNGDGTLANLTFEVVEVKASTLIEFGIYLIDPDGKRWEATTESGEVIESSDKIFGDIDRDGVVNIQDLVIVGTRFGQRGQNSADVNGDGLVDIVDLVLVAGAFSEEAAAPSLYPQGLELLTAVDVRQWLIQAQHLALTDPDYLNGITVLEQLLAALTPKQTVLLPNYPNPFNPETWMPYHLSNDANVQISIYDTRGELVRWLDLGHQIAGYYADRGKAAYWDGRNNQGESVASGVYFYHLSADDYSATRKMLVLK